MSQRIKLSDTERVALDMLAAVAGPVAQSHGGYMAAVLDALSYLREGRPRLAAERLVELAEREEKKQ